VSSGKIQVGQRVWVAASGGRAFGRIASVSPNDFGPEVAFVVMLDKTPPAVVSCFEDRRGSQWDFAEEDEETKGHAET
jgi:hypothetical protein